MFSPEIASQLGHLSFGSSLDSRVDTNNSAKKLISFELGITKSRNSRASQFVTNSISSPIDDDVRFALEEITKPHKSIDAVILEEKEDIKKLTKIEEDQAKYNETTDRVRTPPPFHTINSNI